MVLAPINYHSGTHIVFSFSLLEPNKTLSPTLRVGLKKLGSRVMAGKRVGISILCVYLQVLHSRKLLRSGTIVGTFKIDLRTVYDAPGKYISLKLWVNY